MAKTVTVKPAAGQRVRMPGSPPKWLPEAGALVVLDEYWRNRLKDGEVVEVKEATKKKEH